MYKVEFKKSAIKEFQSLNTPVWDRIKEQILDLQNNPKPKTVNHYEVTRDTLELESEIIE